MTAHNRNKQISYIRETTSVSRKSPQGSELGDRHRSTWLGLQHWQSLKASPLQKQKDTITYIYTLLGTERTSPGVHEKKPSHRVEEGERSMGVRRQVSSVGSVSANCNM